MLEHTLQPSSMGGYFTGISRVKYFHASDHLHGSIFAGTVRGDNLRGVLLVWGGSQPYLNLFKPIPILEAEGVIGLNRF